MENNYQKLKEKLSDLFQLKQADLDFGIYRIMNAKRREVEDYLDNNLQPQVKEILGKLDNSRLEDLEKKLDEAEKAAAIAGFSPKDSPEVQKIRQQMKSETTSEGLEQEIFSDLYNFFSRYYESGDFMSQRRYKKDVYAIPYEGEEVKLHWVNSDQYYIKTAEYFMHYRFRLNDDSMVQFCLRDADVEQNSNKGEKRYFVLCDKNFIEVQDKNMVLHFEYKPVEGKRLKQDVINEEMCIKLQQKIGNKAPKLFALERRANGEQWTVLEKHLNRWTKRNDFDYFIHKDLEGFLRRELDFFIKNEVLYLDDIDSVPDDLNKRLAKLKAVKKIANKIILFLSQMEEFQKRLWLKKKFVIEANYCITLDRVPESFYAEISENKRQIEEWKKLFAIDTLEGYSETRGGGGGGGWIF